MYLSMPVIIGAVAAILLLGWLAFFRRSPDRDLMAPPPSHRVRPTDAPPPPSGQTQPSPGAGLPLDVEMEARKLIEQDKLIQAIKLVRDRTGLGLKEAKDAVDAMR